MRGVRCPRNATLRLLRLQKTHPSARTPQLLQVSIHKRSAALAERPRSRKGSIACLILTYHTLIAAAAAKIKAQLEARKGIQHVDVPPIRSDSTAAAGGPPGGNINGEMYIADGDYIKDIEVNDLRNRYTLTKGSTQKMVITLPGLLLLIYKQ